MLRAVTSGSCWAKAKALVLLGLHLSVAHFLANKTPSPLAPTSIPSLKITASLWATKGKQGALLVLE